MVAVWPLTDRRARHPTLHLLARLLVWCFASNNRITPSFLDLASACSSRRRPARSTNGPSPRRPRRCVVWISRPANSLPAFSRNPHAQTACPTHSQTALDTLYLPHSLSQIAHHFHHCPPRPHSRSHQCRRHPTPVSPIHRKHKARTSSSSGSGFSCREHLSLLLRHKTDIDSDPFFLNL